MATATREQLKSWFKKGLYPLESHFASWIDSYWHKNDTIPVNAIENLLTYLNAKADVLHTHAASDIAGLADLLEGMTTLIAGKADRNHTHTLDDITNIDDFKVDVDSELSDTSENPVQNKVVKAALDILNAKCDDKYKSYTIEFASGADIAQDVNLQGNIAIKRIVGYNVNAVSYVVVGVNNSPIRLSMSAQPDGTYVWEGNVNVAHGKVIVWTAGKVNSGTAAFGVLYE